MSQYFRHMGGVVCLLSKVAISGNKVTTFQDELLGHTAENSNKYSQASPGQAVKTDSAVSSQAK